MIKKIIKNFYYKIKYTGKLTLPFSSEIGLGSTIEGNNKIGERSYFWGWLGTGTYIGRDCEIVGRVGRYTSIAAMCHVLHGIHPYTYPYVTTSPVFYSKGNQLLNNYSDDNYFIEQRYADEINKYPVVIGNDCWINGRVTIVPGVTIGDGAIILAGAVVVSDIPPYAIAGGVPARVIKFRYNSEDISFLLGLKWWDKDDQWLKANWRLLNNLEQLKNNLM